LAVLKGKLVQGLGEFAAHLLHTFSTQCGDVMKSEDWYLVHTITDKRRYDGRKRRSMPKRRGNTTLSYGEVVEEEKSGIELRNGPTLTSTPAWPRANFLLSCCHLE
jgi:hypothetical protein